jgi:2-C-methyl-D-erythritol 4-phosphate cytidylyltransferase
MIEWSLDAFREAGVEAIVVAVPPAEAESSSRRPADVAVVPGGATRAHSVSNALETVETEIVTIHDAARPLLTPELVRGVVETLRAAPEAAAAIAATPIADTVKRAAGPVRRPHEGSGDAGLDVEETLDREQLWAAQTPQVFRTEALRGAIAAMPQGFVPTDEAMLVEQAGGRVLIHPSAAENLKVTSPVDLALAQLLIARREG